MSNNAFGIPPRGDAFPLDRGLFRTYDYTLLAGQKTITVPGQSKTGYNIVVVNGVVLSVGSDYTESQDGKTITLLFDVRADSTAKVLVFSPYQVMDMATRAEMNEAVDVIRYGSTFLFQVTWWPGTRASIPAGWVATDGQILDRATYKDAWARVNAGEMPLVDESVWQADVTKRGCYSRGNGTTTFRAPDLNGKQAGSRAVVLRGDGTDSAGVAGAVQGDAIRNITGTVGRVNVDGANAATFSGALYPAASANGKSINLNTDAATGIGFDASRVVPTANENRMVNATGCYIVKLFGAAINVGAMDAAALAAAKLDKTEFYDRGGDVGAYTFRNKIINGNFAIAQRGALAPSAVGAFIADRFRGWTSGTIPTATSFPDTQMPGMSSSCFGIAGIAGNTGFSIEQMIESSMFNNCRGKQFTFSAWVFSTVSRSISPQIRAWVAKDNPLPGPILLTAPSIQLPAGVWTKVAVSTTTHGAELLNGGSVIMVFGAHTSGSIFTTDWQLEEGTVATPFEQRPHAVEMVMCQRYYEIGSVTIAGWGSVGNIYKCVNCPMQPKRVNPTFTWADLQGTPGRVTARTDNGGSIHGMNASGTPGMDYGGNYSMFSWDLGVFTNNGINFSWAASAEIG